MWWLLLRPYKKKQSLPLILDFPPLNPTSSEEILDCILLRPGDCFCSGKQEAHRSATWKIKKSFYTQEKCASFRVQPHQRWSVQKVLRGKEGLSCPGRIKTQDAPHSRFMTFLWVTVFLNILCFHKQCSDFKLTYAYRRKIGIYGKLKLRGGFHRGKTFKKSGIRSLCSSYLQNLPEGTRLCHHWSHLDPQPYPRVGPTSPFLSPGATENNIAPARLPNMPISNTTAELELEGNLV